MKIKPEIYQQIIQYFILSLSIWFLELYFFQPPITSTKILMIKTELVLIGFLHLNIINQYQTVRSGKFFMMLSWLVLTILYLLISENLKIFVTLQVLFFSGYRIYFLHQGVQEKLSDLMLSLLSLLILMWVYYFHYHIMLLGWSFFLLQLIAAALTFDHKNPNSLNIDKDIHELETLHIKFSYSLQQAERLFRKMNNQSPQTRR